MGPEQLWASQGPCCVEERRRRGAGQEAGEQIGGAMERPGWGTWESQMAGTWGRQGARESRLTPRSLSWEKTP